MNIPEYVPRLGESIDDACEHLVALARESSGHAKMTLNGVQFDATPETDPKQLATSWWNESERLHREYLNSSAGKAQQRNPTKPAHRR
jgi:hypothetical protein